VDTATVNALISAGSGLTGAVVGATGSALVQRGARKEARKDEIAREQRAEARRLADAKDERVREAAERCDEVLSTWVQAGQQFGRGSDRWSVYSEASRKALAALSRETVFLPGDLRERVDEAAQIFRDADSVALDPQSSAPTFHYRSLWSILTTTYSDVHGVIAAWMQGQPLPERSQSLRENIAARDAYESFRDEYYADQDEDYHDLVRKQFYRENPQFKDPYLKDS